MSCDSYSAPNGMTLCAIQLFFLFNDLPGEGMRVCRQPFASKHGVGLSAPDRYPPVERGLESLCSIFTTPTRVPSGTVSAEAAQQPLEEGLQRRSEPMKEMKELES